MGWQDNKFVQYFISARAELKKVAWPTKPEITRYSALVIAISLGVALFFGIIDYFLTIGLNQLIR
jgi:preprotein translocase subunit SecE